MGNPRRTLRHTPRSSSGRVGSRSCRNLTERRCEVLDRGPDPWATLDVQARIFECVVDETHDEDVSPPSGWLFATHSLFSQPSGRSTLKSGSYHRDPSGRLVDWESGARWMATANSVRRVGCHLESMKLIPATTKAMTAAAARITLKVLFMTGVLRGPSTTR